VLRVVLDANVFVSAYINPEGTPGQIIESFVASTGRLSQAVGDLPAFSPVRRFPT